MTTLTKIYEAVEGIRDTLAGADDADGVTATDALKEITEQLVRLNERAAGIELALDRLLEGQA